jgi:hypothetical protein
MAMKGHQPGGGLHSRNVRHSTAPKVEPKSRAHNPATVAQVGAHVGAHITNKSDTGYRGDPDFTRGGYSNPVGPTNMALSGPGAGREILRSGQQSTHGATNPGNPRPNPRREALEQE